MSKAQPEKEMLTSQTALLVWRNLRIVARARGISQEDLAAALQTNKSTLTNMERGLLSRGLMIRIQKWLKTS